MEMEDAGGVVPGGMHRAVYRETRRIYVVPGGTDFTALRIHLDEIGGADLIEHHAVWGDQEMMFGARAARGDMGEDQIVPPEKRDEAIARGQGEAPRPFLRRHHRQRNSRNVAHGVA